jgi:TonB family protein
VETELKLIEKERRGADASVYVVVSLIVHALLLTSWVVYRPRVAPRAAEPVRYVEFVQPRQMARPEPQQEQKPFVTAPGPETTAAVRPEAPLSNANRKASMPNPSGSERTLMPGDGRPMMDAPGERRPPSQQTAAAPQQQTQPQDPGTSKKSPADDRLEYKVASANAVGEVDWRNAIRDVARSMPAATGPSGGGGVGGEEGFAESGPISFETEWFEWGDYADAMIRKIRRNWYANMPEIIKMGMKGVVTIRYTIQRSGQITGVEILNSSGVPPFDYAAKKAIEISSPLNPLPSNFPGQSERVTAQFYYNVKPQRKSPR